MKTKTSAVLPYRFRNAELSSFRLLGLEVGLGFLLSVGLLGLALSQTLLGVLCIATVLVVWLTRVPLKHHLYLVVAVMFIDLQRQVGGAWVYVDLCFAAVLVPVLLLKRLPEFWWVFVPYTFFLWADGAPRALVPAWFLGFALRSTVAMVVYMAAALVDVAEGYFIALGCELIPLVAYGVYQLQIGDFGPVFTWVNPHMDMPWTGRAYSLFWQPNAFGGSCAMAVTMFLSLAFRSVRPKLFFFFAGVGFVGLVSSGSRGGLIALFVSVGFTLWVSGKLRLLAVPVILAGMILVAGNLTDVTFLQRLSQGDRESNEGRTLGNYLGFRAFLTHPVIGVGPTNFEVILPKMHEWRFENTMTVNNIYLQQLAEMGIIGLAAFWLPLLHLIRCGWPFRRDPLVLAGLSSLIVFSVHGLFDYHFEFGPPYLFFFYTACGVFAGRVERCRADIALRHLPTEEKQTDQMTTRLTTNSLGYF